MEGLSPVGGGVASEMAGRAATTPAGCSKAATGDLTDDPGPPDKRRRPRTGNAGALTSSDRAAAHEIYVSNNSASSPSLQASEETDIGA
jgi:hypothetical protein